LPQGATVFATRTIVVSLLVGTLITVFASLRPARRATRVPPIAAVREGSVLPPSRFARYGPVTSLVVLLVAIGLVSLGSLAGGLGEVPRLGARHQRGRRERDESRRARLEARQRLGAGTTRANRVLHGQRLREEAPLPTWLAGARRVPVRAEDDRSAPRNVRKAEGRDALRRRDPVEFALR